MWHTGHDPQSLVSKTTMYVHHPPRPPPCKKRSSLFTGQNINSDHNPDKHYTSSKGFSLVIFPLFHQCLLFHCCVEYTGLKMWIRLGLTGWSKHILDLNIEMNWLIHPLIWLWVRLQLYFSFVPVRQHHELQNTNVFGLWFNTHCVDLLLCSVYKKQTKFNISLHLYACFAVVVLLSYQHEDLCMPLTVSLPLWNLL